MPVTINGRALGVAQNGQFTAANTDPIPGKRCSTCRAWLLVDDFSIDRSHADEQKGVARCL